MIRKLFFLILKSLRIGLIKDEHKQSFISIVCFHRISDEINHAYPSMNVKTFEGLIQYFSENYSVILPKDILLSTYKPKLIITFDDGYKDFLTSALPILKKYNLPAVMNVVVHSVLTGESFWTQKLALIINRKIAQKQDLSFNINNLNKIYKLTELNAEKLSLDLYEILNKYSPKERDLILDNKITKEDRKHFVPMMNLDDLKVCMQNNIEIGSHSYTHNTLHNHLESAQLLTEITDSKITLEKILQTPIEIFASPNGLINESVCKVASEAKYKYIFSTTESLFLNNPEAKIQIAPRILMYRNNIDENILRINLFHKRIKNKKKYCSND